MLPLPLAAEPGFSFADPVAFGLVFFGVALFAAIGALSHQHERAFSASLVYLGFGLVAAVVINATGIDWLRPIEDAELLEVLSEVALIIALFGTGLRIDRSLRWREWGSTVRLLVVVMPLTIAAVAAFGTLVMGLGLGAALVLGAILAPTDPVLAGDVGVGPPGGEREEEPNHALTGEAGFNDGLAFPFVLLGLFVAESDDIGDWLAEWLLADVLYAIGVAAVLGGAVGYALAGLAVRLRERDYLAHGFDAWLAIPAVLVIYGLTEIVGAYGFIAAFIGGLAFRRYERDHEYTDAVHHGAEVVEKIGELALVLLAASMVTLAGLGEIGLTGWLLVPVLLLLIRPMATGLAFVGSRVSVRHTIFIGWFGVRGVGSLYYAAVAAGSGILSLTDASRLWWIAVAATIVSIVVHGISATPLTERLISRAQK